jgi:multiple sugar transport system substrate-binding protein
VQGSNAFSRRSFLTGSSALAALGVLTLAGCSTTVQGASSGGGGAAAHGTKVKTLNFYNNVLGEAGQSQAWQDMIDNFQAGNSSTIKSVVYPSAQAATQLALTARSGNLVGVGQAGPWQVLTPFNILADLSDLASGLNIPQGILDSYTIDGKLLALPQYAGGIGLVADGAIAQSVGLKSGLTTDQFATALERIKSQDKTMIPYAAVTKSDLKDIVPWMWEFGSEVVDDKLNVSIGDAGSVAAVNWYKGLLKQGLIQANVARADARILFARGQTPLYDDAPLAATFVVTNGGKQSLIDNITAIARPTRSGGPSLNRSWGGGLFATTGAGEVTSREFIKFLVNDVASATVLFEESALAPASKSIAAKIPTITKNKFQSAFRTNVTEHAKATGYDKIAVAAQIDTTIANSVAAILAGQTSTQSGLNTLKTQVEALIKANK